MIWKRRIVLPGSKTHMHTFFSPSHIPAFSLCQSRFAAQKFCTWGGSQNSAHCCRLKKMFIALPKVINSCHCQLWQGKQLWGWWNIFCKSERFRSRTEMRKQVPGYYKCAYSIQFGSRFNKWIKRWTQLNDMLHSTKQMLIFRHIIWSKVHLCTFRFIGDRITC